MNILKIDGTALTGIYVDASQSFNKPEKNVSTFAIPGRNGDLIIDEGTFKNVLITYPCYIPGSFESTFATLVNKLGALEGYHKIECSNDSAHFRMGRAIIPQAPAVKRLNKDGWFNLSFDCKPQRFLNSGLTGVTFSAAGTISNPTKFPSRPTIHVGRLLPDATIGDTIIAQTTRASGGISIIDSERMECYESGGGSLNDKFSFNPNEFPVLKPGSNTVDSTLISGADTNHIIIYPNWWEL